MFLSPVNKDEVIRCTGSFATKHSKGFDGISVYVLKRIIDYIAAPLTKIINKSYETGTVPDFCKLARIVPIYKSGDKADHKNYRPISILPAISKIFEKLTLTRLLSFIRQNNILHNSQHGFRHGYSTCTAIAELLDYITKALDNSCFSLSAFFDVSKAFDSINHEILLTKLEHYGIRGSVNSWFRSYLVNRFQFTESAGQSSLLRQIVAGVPQGSILGPILYILYVNDIFYLNPCAKVRYVCR
jgi:retron-type reverse transcriptase